MGNLNEIHFKSEKPDNSISFVYQSDELSIPILSLIDTDAEKAKLEEELKYLQGFLASVEKKLSNKRFVEGAPTKVVEMEQKKKADTESKIKAIEASLSAI